MHVRCRLREILTGRSITQRQLQALTMPFGGVTLPTINALFHDRASGIHFRTLGVLCTALECSVGDLLYLKNE